MSQIAFFTRDGDMRDGRSRISRPKQGALIRATILDQAPMARACSEPLHDPVISRVQISRSLVPVFETARWRNEMGVKDENAHFSYGRVSPHGPCRIRRLG